MFKRNFYFKHLLIVTISLLLKFNYCQFNSNVNQRFYANVTGMNFFRFRDIEPRFSMKTDANVKPVLFDSLVQNIRKPRGFQFHADDRDFSIEMEFVVPFVRIPIERSMSVTQTAFRNLLNLNFHSLLTTGAIVAIGGIFSIILKVIFTQFVYLSNYRKTSRNEDSSSQQDSIISNQSYSGSKSDYMPNINKFTSIMETKLQENNINLSHCIQRPLCNYAQQNLFNSSNVSEGLPLILDGLFSLNFVGNYLSGTAIKSALDLAKSGDNCYQVYSDCSLPFPSKGLFKLLTENLNFLYIT